MADRSKYIFNGKALGKGRTVLEVVRKFIVEHSYLGFDEIRQAFPDELQKGSYQFSADGQCVVKKLTEIMDRKRFHMNRHDQLVSKGVKIVISREWNVENFGKFIVCAEELGYKIEKVK